jgi:hypothetical protein
MMNQQFIESLSDFIFLERQHLYKEADVVLYHPGHFPELNNDISRLYIDEPFKKIMIPNVHNGFLNQNEYHYHKNILIDRGIPKDIILPIEGEAYTANDVIKNAMLQLNHKEDQKILLAGKSFFCRRFFLIASAYAEDNMLLDVLPIEDKRGINKESWFLSDVGTNRVLNEMKMINEFLQKNNKELLDSLSKQVIKNEP